MPAERLSHEFHTPGATVVNVVRVSSDQMGKRHLTGGQRTHRALRTSLFQSHKAMRTHPFIQPNTTRREACRYKRHWAD